MAEDKACCAFHTIESRLGAALLAALDAEELEARENSTAIDASVVADLAVAFREIELAGLFEKLSSSFETLKELGAMQAQKIAAQAPPLPLCACGQPGTIVAVVNGDLVFSCAEHAIAVP